MSLQMKAACYQIVRCSCNDMCTYLAIFDVMYLRRNCIISTKISILRVTMGTLHWKPDAPYSRTCTASLVTVQPVPTTTPWPRTYPRPLKKACCNLTWLALKVSRRPMLSTWRLVNRSLMHWRKMTWLESSICTVKGSDWQLNTWPIHTCSSFLTGFHFSHKKVFTRT